MRGFTKRRHAFSLAASTLAEYISIDLSKGRTRVAAFTSAGIVSYFGKQTPNFGQFIYRKRQFFFARAFGARGVILNEFGGVRATNMRVRECVRAFGSISDSHAFHVHQCLNLISAVCDKYLNFSSLAPLSLAKQQVS